MSNAAAATSASSSSLILPHSSFGPHRKIRPHSLPLLLVTSSSFSRRRQRPRVGPKPSSDRDLSLSIDLDSISGRAASALTGFVRSSRSSVRRFLGAGADAFDDLRTSVRIDPGHHVVFSCRRASVLFFTNLFVFGVVVFVAVRVGAVLGLWRMLRFGERGVVVRRDRSLGGREVVVGTARRRKGNENFRVWVNPVSDFEGIERRSRGILKAKLEGKKEEKLPAWWPQSVPRISGMIANEQLKREADRLVIGQLS